MPDAPTTQQDAQPQTVPQPRRPLVSISLPRYKAGEVEYWLAEAITEFVNGCIAGWKHGVGTGAGTGALTGLNPEMANSLTAVNQITLSVGAMAFAMAFSGFSQVTSWHENGHRFPNPWPRPTGNTSPPFAKPPTQ